MDYKKSIRDLVEKHFIDIISNDYLSINDKASKMLDFIDLYRKRGLYYFGKDESRVLGEIIKPHIISKLKKLVEGKKVTSEFDYWIDCIATISYNVMVQTHFDALILDLQPPKKMEQPIKLTVLDKIRLYLSKKFYYEKKDPNQSGGYVGSTGVR